MLEDHACGWQDPAYCILRLLGNTGRLTLNYCKTCRRHLNGALSCPGCGATGIELSSVQDARSTLRMPKVGGSDRPKSHTRLPIPDSDPVEGDLVSPAERSERGGRRAEKPRPTVVSDAVDGGGPGTRAGSSHARGARDVLDGDSDGLDAGAGDTAEQPAVEAYEAEVGLGARAERHSQRRRGIGLMLVGGFAGMAVIAFLIFGNSAGGGGPSGNAASITSTTKTSTANALTATISASVPRTSAPAVAASVSASPSHSPSQSPSPSETPSTAPATKSSAPATKTSTVPASTSPAGAPTTASRSPSASASPSPSSTGGGCWLIFC